jgi:hypothetical protein
MQGSSSPDPDDSRISGVAALAALGGHALLLLAALFLVGHAPPVEIAPTVVGVTLVGGSAGGQTSSAPASHNPAIAASSASPSQAPQREGILSGESLDGLAAPALAVPAPTSTAARASASPATATAAVPARSGSSNAGQGLGKGEGVEGIDLYAAASLPSVGTRPASPLSGDLWQRVAPCWRSASPRQATLMVEIRADGGLAGSPQAVRRGSAPTDPQTLLAERAAARAVQACAPYSGLEARVWRVEFPG